MFYANYQQLYSSASMDFNSDRRVITPEKTISKGG